MSVQTPHLTRERVRRAGISPANRVYTDHKAMSSFCEKYDKITKWGVRGRRCPSAYTPLLALDPGDAMDRSAVARSFTPAGWQLQAWDRRVLRAVAPACSPAASPMRRP